MNTKKSMISRSFWLILVSGMLTGMGNGSVFGATLICFVGRANFATWGGPGATSYDPYTFNGFMTWSMLVFGFAYIVILLVSMSRHDKLEQMAG